MKRPLAELIGKAAMNTAADVVLLAECEQPENEILAALNHQTGKTFHNAHPLSIKIRVYSSLTAGTIHPVAVYDNGRISIQRLILERTDILLVAVHLPSKMNRDDSDQVQEAVGLSSNIRRAELDYGHTRTILVGDLNMNPFDPGVVGAMGLHGVMTRAIATERTRKVDGQDYHFFYNPMWGLLGDRTPGPAGTHYIRLGKPTEYFWNTYDQVMIRPELLGNFDDDVRVLTEVGGINFLTANGHPNRNQHSDHLPLSFPLNID